MEQMPLFGIPFVVKDNIDIRGWRTTAALPSRDRIAEQTAHAVHLLQRAGAVVLAKTNLDQFATGLVGTRSPFGWVPNPFSPDHISGGSSSGSASAVARGLVCFSLGTDTAGSGRVPAAFCNLFGLKPTPGLVSTAGVLPACASLDCVSVFTLTAEDAAIILPVLADPAARPADEIRFHDPVPERLAFPPVVRVGVAAQPDLDERDGFSAYDEAIARLRELGHTIIPVDLEPLDRAAALLYDGPWVAERYAVAGASIEAGAPGLDPTVARVISKAQGLTATQAFEGLYALKSAEAQARALWGQVDVLMLPTAPGLPRHADVLADPVGCNARLGRYTNAVNLLGWSAMAVPASLRPSGLPFGVTFIGPGGADAALVELACRWDSGLSLPLGAHLAARAETPRHGFATPPLRLAAEAIVPVAVVGAHLRGMPLHGQVLAAGARLLALTRTAPCYRLFALSGGPPHRPGLMRVVPGTPSKTRLAELAEDRAGLQTSPIRENGAAIEVEVYAFPAHAIGSFLAQIAPPLGLGRIELENGQWVQGFICEPWGLTDALDITSSGGWRYYCEGVLNGAKVGSGLLPSGSA